MAYTTVPNSDVDPDSPITTGLVTALRDNPTQDDTPLKGPAGASVDFILSQTASNSVSVDFTANIDSSYDRYMMHLINVLPVATSDLQCRFSQVAAFKTDANYYYAEGENFQSATSADTGQAAANFMRIQPNIINSTSAGGLDCVLYFTTPDLATNTKRIYGHGALHSTSGLTAFNFGGYYNSTGAIDGIQFLMSTGNISTGVFKLYGIKDA